MFDTALARFFAIPAQWAKVMVASEGAVCVKEYGKLEPCRALRLYANCQATRYGGETSKHEVYWHVQGEFRHQIRDSLEAAIQFADDLGGQWANLILESSSNRSVRAFGDPAVVSVLRQYARSDQ